ncbi:uncharacterized protein LOC114276561 [Camellia sinensis]|uniref:uncharacterized protein LOC114276561 n=1 Tax=Camellia sinensis TaxID=4442 RepID=UPI001036B83F|nr:uncharacterized protein LOC114276561 [Camellia sinensis]
MVEEDYQKRIDVSKKKSDEARSEATSDAEMDLLQQELEEEFQRELITNEISDLENQRASVEERREILRKLEQDEMRAQCYELHRISIFIFICFVDEAVGDSGFFCAGAIDVKFLTSLV